jgi:hypothetical protein
MVRESGGFKDKNKMTGFDKKHKHLMETSDLSPGITSTGWIEKKEKCLQPITYLCPP